MWQVIRSTSDEVAVQRRQGAEDSWMPIALRHPCSLRLEQRCRAAAEMDVSEARSTNALLLVLSVGAASRSLPSTVILPKSFIVIRQLRDANSD